MEKLTLFRRLKKRLGFQKARQIKALPVSGWGALGAVFLASWLLHTVTLVTLKGLPQAQKLLIAEKKSQKQQPIKFKVNSKEPAQAKEKQSPPSEGEKILESKLSPSEAPDQADYLGAQNHKAKKQTKLAMKERRLTRGKDPGKQGKGASAKSSSAPNKAAVAQARPVAKTPPVKPRELSPSAPKQAQAPKAQLNISHSDPSGLAMGQALSPRNAYEKLLHGGIGQMGGQINAGYQEYIDDKIAEGDEIDLNTQEYRYIGYFTNMRKAIELVWSYPMAAARRGLDGKVSVKFTIQKDGKVSRVIVLNSSGHQLLDHAIVAAIKLASPFAPLPHGFDTPQLNVTGTFNYVLH